MASKGSPRHARVEEEIRKVLSELLIFEMKDPRLEGVTISSIDLSADRSSCRVFFSLFGDSERERQAADGFVAARSYLRRGLGQRVHLRVTPELTFFRDKSYEYGDRMERLFDRLHEQGILPDQNDPDQNDPDQNDANQKEPVSPESPEEP